MIKAREFPNREFADKSELFKALKEHKSSIIDMKKSEYKKTDSFRFSAIKSDIAKAVGFEDGYIYPVINTTKYLDSHNDVHIDGIWNKSVSEQLGKIYYVADHKLEVTSIIAHKSDVQALVMDLAWKSLGVDYVGNTQALIFKIAKDKITLPQAKQIIESKQDIEHSVRMQYVYFDLALNSTDKDDVEEYKIYNKYINLIANKELAEQQGYFWAVTEAKIYREGSMVLAGSNDVTPMLYPSKNIEPTKVTQTNEPDKTTQEEKKKQLFINLLNKK